MAKRGGGKRVAATSPTAAIVLMRALLRPLSEHTPHARTIGGLRGRAAHGWSSSAAGQRQALHRDFLSTTGAGRNRGPGSAARATPLFAGLAEAAENQPGMAEPRFR